MIIVNDVGTIINFENLVAIFNKNEDLMALMPNGTELCIQRFNTSQIASEYVKNIRKAYSIKQTEFIIGG